MKKYFFLVLSAALLVASCTQTEPDMTFSQLNSNNAISIPMSTEPIALDEENTKSYFTDPGTGWSFVWEDEDNLGYFQYRRGLFQNQGLAEVNKTPTSVNVNYPANDFKAGDAIWTYFNQPDAEAELGDFGIVNNDPDMFYMQIPTTQITSSEPEYFNYEEDYSFQISKVNVTGFKSYTVKGSDQPVGTTPKMGTLKFKIVGYNRDVVYSTGPNTSNLHIDAYGNASVDVTFNPVEQNGTKYTTTTEVKIFVDGYEDYYATIPVTCSVTVKKKISFIIDLRDASLTYSYNAGTPSGASIVLEFSEQGDIKPYPIRNCMPIASKQATITSSMIQYPEDIQSSMTMYILGSVIEFRAYSLDPDIAVGETLYGAIFQSNSGNCAGLCTYDLKGESLTLEDYTESEIITFDEDGLELQYGKENYVPLYMVIGPGTYSATLTFITDKNVYIYEMADKIYSRATKKALNCNFASANCTVISLEDYYAVPEDDPEEEEDEEM